MKRFRLVLLIVTFPFLAGCALHSALPLIEWPIPVPLSSCVYNGYARAFRLADGRWISAPGYDYEFTTFEKRYAKHWEVIKEIHYRDPRYDGGAGQRDQTLFLWSTPSPPRTGGSIWWLEGRSARGRGMRSPVKPDWLSKSPRPKKGGSSLSTRFASGSIAGFKTSGSRR
jgi:hypothetical protein